MSSYDNESYLASLGAARGDINRTIENTLAEINRQRDLAIGQTRQIGGAVKRVAQTGTRPANEGIKQAGSSLAGMGLADIGAGVLADTGQEIKGRFEGLEGAYSRASGLLGQGFGEQAVQRQGTANRIGKQLLTENDLKRTEYISRREGEDRERAFQREMQERNLQAQTSALAEQQRLQEAAIAAQEQQAAEQRAWQERQNKLSILHQAILANPLVATPDMVTELYNGGQAPPGMSLTEYADWLGVPMSTGRPGMVPGAGNMPL